MVQYEALLNASFAALSDPTRREVLEQLGRSDASITDLAERFHMTLTGMKKHVGVLEKAGLVMTEKVAGCGPAGWDGAPWLKRLPGSSANARYGPDGSMRWTILSKN
jgi:hypothetical protein